MPFKRFSFRAKSSDPLCFIDGTDIGFNRAALELYGMRGGSWNVEMSWDEERKIIAMHFTVMDYDAFQLIVKHSEEDLIGPREVASYIKAKPFFDHFEIQPQEHSKCDIFTFADLGFGVNGAIMISPSKNPDFIRTVL